MRMESRMRIPYTLVRIRWSIMHRSQMYTASVDGYPSGGNRRC